MSVEINWEDEEECIKVVSSTSYYILKGKLYDNRVTPAITHVVNQTVRVCKAAIDCNLSALASIRNPTKEILFYAIDKSEEALKYIAPQTREIIDYSLIKHSCFTYKYVKLTREIVKEMAENDRMSMRSRKSNDFEHMFGISTEWPPEDSSFIDEEIALIAIKRSPSSIAYIPSALQTKEICSLAIELSSYPMETRYVLRGIKHQTEELCLMALKKSPECLRDHFAIKIPITTRMVLEVLNSGHPKTEIILDMADDRIKKDLKLSRCSNSSTESVTRADSSSWTHCQFRFRVRLPVRRRPSIFPSFPTVLKNTLTFPFGFFLDD